MILTRTKQVFILWLLLLLITPIYCNLYAQLEIEHTPIPGGIAVIDFASPLSQESQNMPQVFFRSIPVYKQRISGGHHQALVGIPLLADDGEYYVDVYHKNSSQTLKFNVSAHEYKTQNITLTSKQKKFISPSKVQMTRIIKERAILARARETFNMQTSVQSFIAPSTGSISGTFGLKRFYNNKPGRAHTGIDYAAPKGGFVRAPADGIVLLTGFFFFNGNSIFLNHGQGLISALIHLDDIFVLDGMHVKQGEIIGLIGATGRATGPHLHWSLYLNRTAVNPQLLLK